MLPLPDTTAATRKNIARKYKLSQFPDPRPFLHIRCGTDILTKLDQAGIPGDKIRWTDVLCEGPHHRHADEKNRQRERAAYLAGRYFVPFTETYREIMGEDWRVRQCNRYDETVLWFEADLFDQVILVYLLNRLYPLSPETLISLICIGEFPGVRRFIGLGQLYPGQLATLLPKRQQVTPRQFRLAGEAWEAFQSSDPRGLSRISRMRSRALPFLPAAIRRYLAEYPSTRNGLGRTEQLALEAIRDGAESPQEAFLAVQKRERRPFMGDSMFYAVIRDLASGSRPAVIGAHKKLGRLRDRQLRRMPIRLSEDGKALLKHRADWRELCGMPKAIGGVMLRGSRLRWRWDPKLQRIVQRRFPPA